MKNSTRKKLMALLLCLLLFSGAYLLLHNIQTSRARQDYDEAQQLATGQRQEAKPPVQEQDPPPAEEAPPPVPEVADPVAEELKQLDLAALQAVNSDVTAWIQIPGTKLSYPLLQGTDNQYYLQRTWKKEYSAAGAIYLDYRNSADLNDFNTIVYGHRMGDGTMFNCLLDYQKQSYWEEHPAIYLRLEEEVRRYEIFAAYKVEVEGSHSYRLGLKEAEGQQAYINYCKGLSVIDCGITPQPGQKILTLSTCPQEGSSSGKRWLVHAVWTGE